MYFEQFRVNLTNIAEINPIKDVANLHVSSINKYLNIL